MRNSVYILAAAALLFSLFVFLSFPLGPAQKASIFIDINGIDVPVPPGIGNRFVHTDAWDNVIHFSGPVTLGDFFSAWGVRFNDKCIFQFCNEDYHVFVNGIENYDFSGYRLRNGDQIEILVSTL